MILLLTVPHLGQAGVKRLQISRRRTRQDEPLTEIASVPNRRDTNRSLNIAAHFFLKSAHFHNLGLRIEPMFAGATFSSHQLAVGQSPRSIFPADQSNSEYFNVSLNSGSGNSGSGTSGLDNSGSVLKSLWKNAHVLAPIVPCFSRVPHQPRSLLVQAFLKV
jgi:hypothetical protein